MGLIKPNGYRKEEMKFSMIGKAVSHPARNRILELLMENNFIRNTDLPDYLNLNQATVTQHLDMMKKAKIIDCNYFVHFDVLSVNHKTLEYYIKKLEKWRR